jgi:hypothetical protein
MNKVVFFITIFLLALGISLGAVYFLNFENFNQDLRELTSNRLESETRNPENYIEDTIDYEVPNVDIIVDENTPENYSNQELINLEKELNSLDLSNLDDLQ